MNHLPFEQRQYEIIQLKQASTNEKFGKSPSEQSVKELLNRGIIVLDKPSGPTSHQATDYVKRILGLRKAGHTGTLDPGVTGVLPVALQDATRITHALLTAGKEYVCLMHIHENVSEEKFEAVIKEFTGKINQLPPKKSAVRRRLRERSIYYFEVLERKEKDVLFKVGCQAGTYIRKLVHDMGEKLGCGAHMAELRRTKAGPFDESKVVTLQDLADAYHYYKEGDDSHFKKFLLPIESGVEHIKKIWVLDSATDPLCNGAYLKVPGIAKFESDIEKGDQVAVMTLKDELVLLGESMYSASDIKSFDKGIAVKTKQVFMKAGTYKE